MKHICTEHLISLEQEELVLLIDILQNYIDAVIEHNNPAEFTPDQNEGFEKINSLHSELKLPIQGYIPRVSLGFAIT